MDYLQFDTPDVLNMNIICILMYLRSAFAAQIPSEKYGTENIRMGIKRMNYKPYENVLLLCCAKCFSVESVLLEIIPGLCLLSRFRLSVVGKK